MFYAKFHGFSANRIAILHRLARRLEGEQFEIEYGRNELLVAVPGFETRLFPTMKLPALTYFWDRVRITPNEDGSVAYRWIYWSGVQSLLHLLATVLFALEFLLGPKNDGAVFLRNLVLANAVPFAAFTIQVAFGSQKLRQAIRECQGDCQSPGA